MNRFKALRYERGLTITDVAKGAQISRPTVYALEQSDAVPSAPVAKALADFYGVTVAELLGANGNDAPVAA